MNPRALFCLTALALLALPAPAEAGRLWERVKGEATDAILPGDYCPRLSEPIECRDRTEDDRPDRGGREGDDRDPMARYERKADRTLDRWHRERRNHCDRLRDQYRFHHPFAVPDSLRRLHGCDRWEADAAYHRGEDFAGITEGPGDLLDTGLGVIVGALL